MTIAPLVNERVAIQIQLHPSLQARYLPSNLKLILLSQTGKILREVTSRSHDNWIQLPSIECHAGEKFGVQIALNNVTIS
jgi:hypothetical protein